MSALMQRIGSRLEPTRVWQSYTEQTREWTHEQLIEHYTNGYCGVLAAVIVERLGWETWGVCTGSRSTGEATIARGVIHIVVRDPASTLYADAYGHGMSGDEVLDPYFNRHFYDRCGKPRQWHLRRLAEKRWFPRPATSDPSLYYHVCEHEHLPRLLPGLAARMAAARGERHAQ